MNIPQSKPSYCHYRRWFRRNRFSKTTQEQNVQVVLLDQHNYHNFQPLWYQVATGGLEAGSIAYPIRKVIQEYDDFLGLPLFKK
jgi:NADH dehydrogenase